MTWQGSNSHYVARMETVASLRAAADVIEAQAAEITEAACDCPELRPSEGAGGF